MRLFLFAVWWLFLAGGAAVVRAAPIPATSSSAVIAMKEGYFRSPAGFFLEARDSGWALATKPNASPSLKAIYRGAANSEAMMTVRVEEAVVENDAQTYAQKWLREFPRLGMEVLAAKPLRVGAASGYLLDLLNKANKKQLRQVVFLRQQKAVVLTCRDNIETFGQSLKSCNQIIRSFSWVQD